MPCLLALLIVLFPRIAIVILYFFTNFFTGVYETILLPLMGFIFLPVTLVAYTYLTKNHYPVDAVYLVIMIVAVAFDLGLLGGAHRSRK
jgi:hypothetical protein